MKLAQLTDPKYKEILEKMMKLELPITTAYKLKDVIKKSNEELAKYEEFRNELVKKYADRDEAGEFKIDADNKINVSAENMQLFLKDLQDLLTQEVSVGELKLSQLGEKAMLSAEDLFKLDGLIKE